MDKLNRVFVYMALLALFVYPISIYGSVLIAVTALVLSIALVREKELINKVLQPSLLLAILVVIRSVFGLLLLIIQKFAYIAENYEVFNNIDKTISFIDAILLIVLIAFIVIATVFIVINKDIPFVSSLTAKITGLEQPKEEKQKPAKTSKPVTQVKTKKSGKKTVVIIDATRKPETDESETDEVN